ncbi:transmembrane protein [Arabidopsis thaliana]|uniref:Transmembrane protein n=1 Tax=Arabidopsis thaliana TaxID=3702 RepID=A0A1P8B909_ARATH|nr:uncharacterized protein AT4G12990 [Arabidopsis thaliana]ANM68084.1 transmembrane protein [Arabidopsis thaliana]|eukprot:NP_001329863.1 transmembrane protein [Arabidopsis thaliana]
MVLSQGSASLSFSHP